VDINGDGHIDVLSGSYSRSETGKPMAGLIQVLYGTEGGVFKKCAVLNGTDGEPLLIPAKASKDKNSPGGYEDGELTKVICTRPYAVDWDGDGQLDLIVGNFEGTFYFFKGEGKGKFAPKPEQIKGGDKPLKISGVHSDPIVLDWDKDGDLDLLSGSSDGSICWAENTAGKGKLPVLKAFETLVSKGRYPEGGAMLKEDDLTRPNYGVRIWVADVNGDGKLDILAGDQVTLVSPAKGLTEDEVKSKLKDWEAELKKVSEGSQEMYKERQKLVEKEKKAKKDENKEEIEAVKKELDEFNKKQQKSYEEQNKVYEKRDKIVKEEVTGYVWVYLQK
jgi:hypothetical protein